MLALLTLLTVTGRATAQEVYRASWLIQDRGKLQQEVARSIIERANDWLTRDNPNAPTARLDDPLRVTVVVEFIPATGKLNSRLARLVLGTIVIDHGFDNFLDSTTIASLIKRDQYWREESVTVTNEALSPLPASISDSASELIGTQQARSFAAVEAMPVTRISLEQSSIRITQRLHAWAGLGFEELALPGFVYGRLRAGIVYDAFRIWGEVPAAAGARGTPLFARGYSGGFGAGLSFDMESFGGSITWSDPLQKDDRADTANAGYILGRSALFYGKIPLESPFFGGYLRLKVGGGYLQTVQRTYWSQGLEGVGLKDQFLPMARVEYASDIEAGGLMHAGALELFGDNLLFTYLQQFSQSFGARVTLSAHGLLGALDPYLPPYSILISPVISLW